MSRQQKYDEGEGTDGEVSYARVSRRTSRMLCSSGSRSAGSSEPASLVRAVAA